MKTNEFIIYAIFVAGIALFYDTKEVCEQVASDMTGAELVKVETFSDMI